MRSLPDKCVDLVVTSPPYNFDAGAGLSGNKYNGQSDNNPDYGKFISDVIKESLRISRLIFFNIQFIAGNKTHLMRLLGEYAEYVKEIIIWDKQSSEPAMEPGVLNSEFEFIFVFSNEEPGRKFQDCNFERGSLANIFRLPKNYNRDIKTHSALFPLKLPQRIVGNFLKQGGVVYDPFMGGGTTAIACEILKTKWLGTEISAEYCEIANKRIAAEVNQLKLF